MNTDHTVATPRSCPSDEFLIAALTNGISDDEQHWLDAHLETCDRCLDTVGAASHRLRIADEIPAAVPEAVRRRAGATPEPFPALLPEPRPAMDRPAPSWLPAREPATPGNSAARARLAALVRPPVMIPLALAALAVLVVMTQNWMNSDLPRAQTRSISVSQRTRVTAVEAPVRRQPSGHAEVVATVTRGTLVEISGEERDWLHITLPNGSDGWIDQEALR